MGHSAESALALWASAQSWVYALWAIVLNQLRRRVQLTLYLCERDYVSALSCIQLKRPWIHMLNLVTRYGQCVNLVIHYRPVCRIINHSAESNELPIKAYHIP
jgi:hypothetical protein